MFASVDRRTSSTHIYIERVIMSTCAVSVQSFLMPCRQLRGRLGRTSERQWQWTKVRHYVPVMVKTLLLGLLAATICCGFVYAAPKLPHQHHPEQNVSIPDSAAPPLEDPAARSERSTNLSHVTGTARKIQMFIKNRHLQILPDGTVNGTTDDNSAYSESNFFCIPTYFFLIYLTPGHQKYPFNQNWGSFLIEYAKTLNNW